MVTLTGADYEQCQQRLAAAEAGSQEAYEREVRETIMAPDSDKARQQALARLTMRCTKLVAEIGMDRTVPGGRYIDASGCLVDANGQPIT